MGETTTPQIRERVWVTKLDHATDPPTPVEEVFVENGVVVGRRDLRPQAQAQEQEKEETDGA